MEPTTGIYLVVIGALALAVVGLRYGLRLIARRRGSALLEEIDATLLGGTYQEAADMAVAALASRAESARLPALRCRLARALVGLEEYAKAERVCREAAEAAPGPLDRAMATIELGRCLAATGDFEGALESLEQTRSVPLPAELRAARDVVAADVRLARLEFEEAEGALASAFATVGTGPVADEAAVGHARLQYLRGNFRQAAAEINRVLERLRGDDLQALALLYLARALLDQERPAPVEADQAISSALVLVRYPGYAATIMACHGLVQAHFDNGAEALDATSRAVRMTVSPRYLAETHCLAGDALRRMGRIAEARASYQRALGIDAGCLEGLWGLGQCAQASGLYEIAESYFKLCVDAAPEHFIGQRSEDAIET